MPGSARNSPARPVDEQARSPGSTRGRSSRAGSRLDSEDIEPPTPSTPGRAGSVRSTPNKNRRRNGPANGNVVPDSSDGMSLPSTSPRRNPATSPFPAMSEIDLSSPLNYGTPSSLGSVRTPRSGIQGTPIRMRPDLQMERRIRTVNLDSDQPVPTPSDNGVSSPAPPSDDAGPQLVIWGTDVVVNQCKAKFKRFILRFIDLDTDLDERYEGINVEEPFYLQKLKEIHTLEEPYLNINCAHLKSFDPTLYRQLICYPQEVIPTFDMAINEMFFERYPAAVLKFQIQVRPFNVQKTENMRSLNPEDIDQLITISGMVIRTSNISPEMREALFRCSVCNKECNVEIDRGRIAEPNYCNNCNTNYCYQLIHNRSSFTDRQMIKLQESPDDMPPGQTPHTVVLFAHNNLVDVVQAGDRVTVTGIYRAVPIQINPRMRNVRAAYKTHIDVLHFRKLDRKRLHEVNEGKTYAFSEERLEEIRMLSEKDDLYDRLARAIAPSIYENIDIKKGILLQLFGGTKKSFESSGRKNFRADINILLCGDPGTSKSQLLQYVYNLLPRSQYTSGKGSSAVGLTAYVTKDPESRQLVLQTGALVLADNGVCCIDEFDKMNDSTRSVLHEVMEQQTLSIAKAGIICQLNARTSILAAANPSESQWNKNKTIIENIQLPHTLMSRFDLIFLILDPHNELYDRRLAQHLVSLYFRQDENDDQIMDMSLLRDYLAYAKENVHPKLTQDSKDRLVTAYVEMRKIGSGRGQISAYPRQLESLIRLSEAHAKMRLSESVDVQDVEEAYRLHREALKQSATDPLSGKIDVGILTTGLSSAARKKRMEMSAALKTMIQGKSKTSTSLNVPKLLAEFRESSQLDVLNTFCWIHSTYTIKTAFSKEVGKEVPYPGVDSSRGNLQDQKCYRYYQWVCFCLFFQAILFYTPRWLWKNWEGGKINSLMMDLDIGICSKEEKNLKTKLLSDYLYDNLNLHNWWAYKYFLCELLALGNVVGQMFLMNRFFDGEFFNFGINVIRFMEADEEDRTDPMIFIFPRMTKCTFYKFGVSGEIERHDAVCILPLNVVNEKIYVFLWFWFLGLGLLTLGVVLYRVVIITSPRMRVYLLRLRFRLVRREAISVLVKESKMGDWFLFYMLGVNVDSIIFRDVMHDLAKRLQHHHVHHDPMKAI